MDLDQYLQQYVKLGATVYGTGPQAYVSFSNFRFSPPTCTIPIEISTAMDKLKIETSINDCPGTLTIELYNPTHDYEYTFDVSLSPSSNSWTSSFCNGNLDDIRMKGSITSIVYMQSVGDIDCYHVKHITQKLHAPHWWKSNMQGVHTELKKYLQDVIAFLPPNSMTGFAGGSEYQRASESFHKICHGQ